MVDCQQGYPSGLLVTTPTIAKKNYIWGFKSADERLMWVTLARALASSNPVLRGFVNPGINQIHVCVIYKAVFDNDHPAWSTIIQDQQKYQKDFRHPDNAGVTPLHIAAYFNLVPELKTFVQNGSFLNSQEDVYNRTALHLSLINDSFGAFDVLIGANAASGIADYQGMTVQMIVKKEYVGSKYEARLNSGCYIVLESFL